MPRLIDAEKADRRIEQFLCGGCDDYHNCGNCLAHKALSFLRGEPTVDAVEVVRCRDCKHREVQVDGVFRYEMCGMRNEIINLEGFCHMGERREDAKTD